jgi:hypothetical protein
MGDPLTFSLWGLIDVLGQCEFCQRKARINFEDMRFCGRNHLNLHKKKEREARVEVEHLTECSTCRNLLKGKKNQWMHILSKPNCI